ncbi:MAG: HAMP domain-containing histidine kinase [Planctomycetes bacterium]|nr:HAMP domain-containing histidine kinase [Planctomycetota bacterium]
MSGGSRHLHPAPAAIGPADVARALSGVSEAVLCSLAELSERCEAAERELAALRDRGPATEHDPAAQSARVHELEQRLAGEERLARLGAMAGGIAHEIRNPLHAARGFAELIERHADRDGNERRWATRIVEAVDEVEEVATSLLSIASRKPLAREGVDPDELVATAVASARRVLDGRGGAERWTITNSVDCPRFAGDRIKLRTALRNLVANALQAVPDGGRVDVRVTLAGGEIEIAVHDSGSGVPAHARRGLDEPFFTTKCEGTGLGLVLVRAIAELHGGRFEVSASHGPLGGAATRLRIPFEPR